MQSGHVIADRFEVVALANTGGMGAVYSARDRTTGLRVAVKVLSGCGTKYAQLFAREARVLADLRHPGIVRYVAHGDTDGGDMYLAMEWLEGEDLAERLVAGPISVSESLTLGEKVGGAMAAAHARGVIHRDIKPSNLFLREREVELVKLLDFGVARSRQATRPATLTGVIVGTPGYLAPEQALGAKDLDARADVFSLGCVLYECLTGGPAFEGEHVMLLLARILIGEAPRVRDRRPEVPEAFGDLIARMMAKDPAKRPRDGAELIAELASIREGRTIVATRVQRPATKRALGEADTLPGVAPRAGGSMPVGAGGSVPVDDDAAAADKPSHWVDPPFVLLGEPSPFFGRERELDALTAAFDRCASARMPHAVLLTGAAGAGKSRLRVELLRRLASRGSPPAVWTGAGDPLGVDSPLRVLSQVIRDALGLPRTAGGPRRARLETRLRAAVARTVAGPELKRVSEFIGELIDLPAAHGGSVALRAARQDARLMGDQIRRAFRDWATAETTARPVVLVLEDMHWVDAATATFVDDLLHDLGGLPLFVLAVARPEVHARFPALFAGRTATEVPIFALSSAACESIARHAFGAAGEGDPVPTRRTPGGERIPGAMVERVAAGSGGNPLRLDEMIRAVALDAGDLEDGDVKARIDALEPETRRALLAASVFGCEVSERAVNALLEEPTGTRRLADWMRGQQWLNALVRAELLTPLGDAALAKGHVFRHDQFRDAAYAMLPDEERVLAHLRAGEWLERSGGGDPGVIAQHFERGLEPSRAAGWCGLAAERALKAHDYARAVSWAERGVACGAEADLLGTLRLLQAEAHKWMGANEDALTAAGEALSTLPRGSPLWYSAAGEVALACGNLGRHEQLIEVFAELETLAEGGEAGPTLVIARSRAALQLLSAGRHDLADLLLGPIEQGLGDMAALDPEVMASIHRVRAFSAMYAGDAGRAAGEFEAAALCFDHVGDLRNACIQRVNVGYAMIELGAYAQAEAALRSALAAADRMGLYNLVAFARHNLGLALARQGQLYEARTIETAALDSYVQQGVRRLEGGSRIYLAMILALGGDLDGAERQALLAIEVLSHHPPARAQALATLARTRVLQGRPKDALEPAEEAMRLLDEVGGIEEGESLVRLELAVAQNAAGNRYAARKAIVAARDRLLARAEKIQDPSWRASFLAQVPENARTMTLARSWVGD